jgi:Zn-dependent protease with chaperone function
MRYNVYASVMLAASFALLAPLVSRRVRPAAAAWLLSIGAVICALCGTIALALLASTIVGQDDDVADEGHWSPALLHHADPVHESVAIAALVALVVSLERLRRAIAARSRSLHTAYQLSRDLVGAGDLTVMPEQTVEAYAIPGDPGRVVVTRGLLRVLDIEQGAAVLAHERSHLRHGHHHHRALVAMACALNPMLRPLVAAQEWATERWADEDAAAQVNRTAVAAALRRVGTSTLSTRPDAALTISGAVVDRRIAAMLGAPPRWRPLLLFTAILLLVLAVCATGDAMSDAAAMFHAAAYPVHASR